MASTAIDITSNAPHNAAIVFGERATSETCYRNKKVDTYQPLLVKATEPAGPSDLENPSSPKKKETFPVLGDSGIAAAREVAISTAEASETRTTTEAPAALDRNIPVGDNGAVQVPQGTVIPTLIDLEAPAIIEAAAGLTEVPSVRTHAVQGRNVPASTRLQRMIKETNELIVCPGVYDGLSARTAIEVGFDSLYMTGAGTSASRLGMADLGLATLHDMRAQAEMICNLKPHGPPVIADMDTGYGGAMMVYRAVCEYIRAGVAGFHLEDQLLEKRCGHLKGKAVVAREEWYIRIRAALQAKADLGSDIVLIARTDALQQHGYDECIGRLRVARNLGCDVGLLEGFRSKEQARRCVKDLEGWPLMLNSVENGASPLITVSEARDMGFRLMIFSFASIAPAYQAIRSTFQKLKVEGIIGTKGEITPRKIFEVCGLEDLAKIDMSSGGSSFKNGV
ncbi:MAG: hypothetical protein M1821_009061 [Bathelium mastoideum]|nr:MAG: hypothetical protein M1821_009061 [Bathelium mastoideum]